MYCDKCGFYVSYNKTICTSCNKVVNIPIGVKIDSSNRTIHVIKEPKGIVDLFPTFKIEELLNQDVPSYMVDKLTYYDNLEIKISDNDEYDFKTVSEYAGENHPEQSRMNDIVDYSGTRRSILLWKRFDFEAIAIKTIVKQKRTSYKNGPMRVYENYSVLYNHIFFRRKKETKNYEEYRKLEKEYNSIIDDKEIYEILLFSPRSWAFGLIVFFLILLPITIPYTLVSTIVKSILNSKNKKINKYNHSKRIDILQKAKDLKNSNS